MLAAVVIYLSGIVRPEILGMRPDLGVILTPDMGNAPDLSATAWAADNGCFNAGERFSLDRFFAFLTKHRQNIDTCLFAVAPDVVGDAAATWDRSRTILPLIRAAGYRAALAGQDGLENIASDWDAFDALFIGGSTRWKLSHHARDAAKEAKARGKWVHMGRVNSLRRMQTAYMIGCDSADGTFLRAAPDINMPKMVGWLDSLQRHPPFVFAGVVHLAERGGDDVREDAYGVGEWDDAQQAMP